MSTAQYFTWLPNALTLSRAILAIPIFLTAQNEAWVVCFWLYAIALLTDFFDGLAAKKLNAYSKYGQNYDSAADGLLAAGGVMGLAAAGQLSWWAAIFVLAVGLILGSRYYWFGTQKTVPALEMTAKVCLFSAWIGSVWLLASLAFGWAWWYVPLTLLVCAAVSSLKRHRLRAWLKMR